MWNDNSQAAFARSWRRACDNLDCHEDTTAVFDMLLGRYSEPHRRYHTVQHLSECVAAFEFSACCAANAGAVEAAIWFHDAIYDPTSHENELRSAQLAFTELTAVGICVDSARRVSDLVLATKHSTMPMTQDERIIVDIDLAILGAAPTRFAEYEDQIREEYSWVADSVFYAKRKAVLASFLARGTIYSTQRFRSLFEAQARSNILNTITNVER